MEKLEQIGGTIDAANDGVEKLREGAQALYDELLSSEEYQQLDSLAEKAGYLRGLILEKGATLSDTSVPVDNSQRFLVELLARDLSLIEQAEIDEIAAQRMMVA